MLNWDPETKPNETVVLILYLAIMLIFGIGATLLIALFTSSLSLLAFFGGVFLFFIFSPNIDTILNVKKNPSIHKTEKSELEMNHSQKEGGVITFEKGEKKVTYLIPNQQKEFYFSHSNSNQKLMIDQVKKNRKEKYADYKLSLIKGEELIGNNFSHTLIGLLILVAGVLIFFLVTSSWVISIVLGLVLLICYLAIYNYYFLPNQLS